MLATEGVTAAGIPDDCSVVPSTESAVENSHLCWKCQAVLNSDCPSKVAYLNTEEIEVYPRFSRTLQTSSDLHKTAEEGCRLCQYLVGIMVAPMRKPPSTSIQMVSITSTQLIRGRGVRRLFRCRHIHTQSWLVLRSGASGTSIPFIVSCFSMSYRGLGLIHEKYHSGFSWLYEPRIGRSPVQIHPRPVLCYHPGSNGAMPFTNGVLRQPGCPSHCHPESSMSNPGGHHGLLP